MIIQTRNAEKVLRRVRGKDKKLLLDAIENMRVDPFAGDVKSLTNDPHAAFRRRVGAWRIFFDVEPDGAVVMIAAVLRRTTTPYRKR